MAKVQPVPWLPAYQGLHRSTGSRIPISISLEYLSLVGLNSLVNKVDTGSEVKNIVNNHPRSLLSIDKSCAACYADIRNVNVAYGNILTIT